MSKPRKLRRGDGERLAMKPHFPGQPCGLHLLRMLLAIRNNQSYADVMDAGTTTLPRRAKP